MSRLIFNDYIQKELISGYGGREPKIAVMLSDNKKYFLKMPVKKTDEKGRIFGGGNVIAEHVGCEIFRLLGFPAQETKLGEYIDKHGVTEIVCACRDFKRTDEELCEMKDVFNGLGIISDSRKKITFGYMDEAFKKFTGEITEKEISDFYYDMFVVDALIGNINRHNRNWGILQTAHETKIAPVYDCGSSLAHLITEEAMSVDKGACAAMNAVSILGGKNNERIIYAEFFHGNLSVKMKKALERIVPKIDISEIEKMIYSEKYISNTRKQFYISFIRAAYENILLPALYDF